MTIAYSYRTNSLFGERELTCSDLATKTPTPNSWGQQFHTRAAERRHVLAVVLISILC